YKSINKWRVQARREPIRAKSYFVVSGDVDNPDSNSGSRTALQYHIKTTGCLPLIFSHHLYGLLYLHCTKHHFFTESELEALETFGVQVAIAINNAKLIGPSYGELYGNALLNSIETD
ncbi:MAG: GAF domain-containing protein, partial [Dehalococcoidia bacterium]|nr:GAF domain-containing protein [Dehalococcoidia bacterium]